MRGKQNLEEKMHIANRLARNNSRTPFSELIETVVNKPEMERQEKETYATIQ